MKYAHALNVHYDRSAISTSFHCIIIKSFADIYEKNWLNVNDVLASGSPASSMGINVDERVTLKGVYYFEYYKQEVNQREISYMTRHITISTQANLIYLSLYYSDNKC